MAILLYGHPDAHGPNPPVTVYWDGETHIMIHPDILKAGGHTHTTPKGEVLEFKRPLEFATELDAAVCASKLPMKTRSVDTLVAVDISGKLLSSTPIAAAIDYTGKTLSKSETVQVKG